MNERLYNRLFQSYYYSIYNSIQDKREDTLFGYYSSYKGNNSYKESIYVFILDLVFGIISAE